jgi:hypothetical protein
MPGNLIYYALVLIVVALLAALFGFGGVSATAMSGAHLGRRGGDRDRRRALADAPRPGLTVSARAERQPAHHGATTELLAQRVDSALARFFARTVALDKIGGVRL